MELPNSPGEGAAGTPRTENKPPGPIVLAFGVMAVGALLFMYYGWWPSPFGDFEWTDPLLAGAIAFLILVVVGLVWAVRSLYVIGEDGRWSWWIVPVPTVVVVSAATAFLLPPPTFLDKSPEFERIAHRLLENPGASIDNLEIGPFDISNAQSTPSGQVYFTDADSMFTTTVGWVYSPNGEPSGFDDFSATHLGGPWYEFTAVWTH